MLIPGASHPLKFTLTVLPPVAADENDAGLYARQISHVQRIRRGTTTRHILNSRETPLELTKSPHDIKQFR